MLRKTFAVLVFGLGFFAAGYFSAPSAYRLFPAEDVAALPISDSVSASTEPEEPIELRLLFAGDIMLSRSVGIAARRAGDPKHPFLKIGEFLRTADIAFANLESPISSRGENVGSIHSFRADPQVVEGLVYAGFDALSFANNHAWDYGRDAFRDTLAILRSNDISPVGAGETYKEAHTPAVFERRGVAVAFLAYTTLLPKSLTSTTSIPAVAAPDALVADIENTESQADIIIVSFHWGEEYLPEHNKEQEALAKAAIDAGADLVIGHHPHVLQELEAYGGGYVAYSLGNFVFDQAFSEETMRSAVLEATVRDGRVSSARLIPVRINASFQPEVLE